MTLLRGTIMISAVKPQPCVPAEEQQHQQGVFMYTPLMDPLRIFYNYSIYPWENKRITKSSSVTLALKSSLPNGLFRQRDKQ